MAMEDNLHPVQNAPTAQPGWAATSATPVMVGDVRMVMLSIWSHTGTHVTFFDNDSAIGLAENILAATGFNTDEEAAAEVRSRLSLPPAAGHSLVGPDGVPLGTLRVVPDAEPV